MVTKTKSRTGKRKKEATPTSLKAEQAQPANGNGTSPSNQDVLRRLYAAMLKCRMLAERVQGQAQPDDYDFEIGHEAVVVGATVELGPQDTMVASPRNFAAYIAKGVSLEALRSQPPVASGAAAVMVTDRSMSPALCFDPFNLGTGLALAHRLEKRHNVVIALCSEEPSAPDGWHEAMKFAGVHKLPIIYVKKVSAFEPGSAKRTPALEALSFMARDCGFPGIVVDGGDAVAVWRVAYESIHRARNGAGPTLIECEIQSACAGDPLAHLEHYMRKRDIWDDEWKQDTADGIDAER